MHTAPPSTSRYLAGPQRARLQRFGIEESVDLHCHILPGIDDGPTSLDEAILLARAMVRDGFTTVVATPHQMGRYDGMNQPQEIRARVRDLQSVLDQLRIPLTLAAGAEVRVDERLAQFARDDRVLTLGDTRKYMLLELPWNVPIGHDPIMRELTDAGVLVVLAHGERYGHLA